MESKITELKTDRGNYETYLKQLEEELKLSRLKGKAYEIMVNIAKEEYGLDLEKKPGAKQSRDSKKKNPK